MTGIAKVKINGFDFDSYTPVQGEVIDAVKQETLRSAFNTVSDFILTIDVLLFGAFLMTWWIDGGFVWGSWFFHKFAPALMRMITTGQVY